MLFVYHTVASPGPSLVLFSQEFRLQEFESSSDLGLSFGVISLQCMIGTLIEHGRDLFGAQVRKLLFQIPILSVINSW